MFLVLPSSASFTFYSILFRLFYKSDEGQAFLIRNATSTVDILVAVAGVDNLKRKYFFLFKSHHSA